MAPTRGKEYLSRHVQPNTEAPATRLGRPGRLGGTAPTLKIPRVYLLWDLWDGSTPHFTPAGGKEVSSRRQASVGHNLWQFGPGPVTL